MGAAGQMLKMHDGSSFLVEKQYNSVISFERQIKLFKSKEWRV